MSKVMDKIALVFKEQETPMDLSSRPSRSRSETEERACSPVLLSSRNDRHKAKEAFQAAPRTWSGLTRQHPPGSGRKATPAWFRIDLPVHFVAEQRATSSFPAARDKVVAICFPASLRDETWRPEKSL